MTHIHEDELLKFALEILDEDSERRDIEAHLATCRECSALLEHLQRDIDIISGVRPYCRLLRIPNPKVQRTRMYSIIKAAALVIFGVLVGLGLSAHVRREPATVIPAYINLSPPDNVLASAAVSDATGISNRYYDKLLREQD